MSRLFIARLVCPYCDTEHYFESPSQIEVLDPVRLGLGSLCGVCEAMRRCVCLVGGKVLPFWSDALEARCWGKIRHHTDKYQMQVWEIEPHGQQLRDDQTDVLLSLIGVPPEKSGYPIRYKYRWTEAEMHAKGIRWQIPAITQSF